MFKKIDHIALHVKNIQDSIEFYKNIFGFTMLFENKISTGDLVVYMKLGDTILELNEIYEGSICGTHFCLYTTDFETDYNYLINNNIKIRQSAHNTNPRTADEVGWKRAVFIGINDESIEIRGK